MAHETHHDAHTDHHHHVDINAKPNTSSSSAFWFVLILAGLFIAAVNFIGVMGHDEEAGHDGGHGAATHEQHTTAPAHGTDATHHQAATPAADGEHHSTTPAMQDTAHTEGHESH